MKCLIVVYIIFPIGLYLILCPGPFTASFPEQFSFLHRFFLRYELTDEFDVPEEFTGYYPDDRIARNGHEHAEDTSYLSGHQQDYEDFERMGAYAARVDYGLEEIVVDDLGEAENGYADYYEHPEIHVYPEMCRAYEFQYDGQHRSDCASGQRPHIRYDVEQAGEEGDAYGCIEAHPRHKEQPEEIDDCNSAYLYHQSEKIP